MLEQNIRYRAAIYAALYTPPMSISRQTATSLYNDLAERGFQKLGFEYTPPDEDKSFSILMVEKGEGRRTDSIQIDILQGSLRLLLNQTWPDSFDVACKKADQVALAITNVLTGCQIQLIEARIRSQAAIPEKSGNEYLMSRLMPGKKSAIAGLGTICHFGIHCELAVPEEDSVPGPLACPGREVTVEPLKQEEGFLYMEVMSNWGRTAIRLDPGKPGQAEIKPGPLETPEDLPPPSAYLREVRDYLENRLCPFLEK